MTEGEKDGAQQSAGCAQLRVGDAAFRLRENEEENHESTDKLTQLQKGHNNF